MEPGKSRLHGESLQLCEGDTWTRDGWHQTTHRWADGGSGRSRNPALGGPGARSARGESPGNATSLASLPDPGQGPGPVSLKCDRQGDSSRLVGVGATGGAGRQAGEP